MKIICSSTNYIFHLFFFTFYWTKQDLFFIILTHTHTKHVKEKKNTYLYLQPPRQFQKERRPPNQTLRPIPPVLIGTWQTGCEPAASWVNTETIHPRTTYKQIEFSQRVLTLCSHRLRLNSLGRYCSLKKKQKLNDSQEVVKKSSSWEF